MDRVWLTRLRWRLSAALMWPLAGVLLVADTVLIHELPFAGSGPDWFLSVLLAGFFSLLVMAVAAPLGGLLLRRRRADLPAVVAGDRVGSALLVALTAALAIGGLAHHGRLAGDRIAFAAGLRSVKAYVAHNAPAQYRRRVAETSALRFGDNLYRACVPGDDPKRWLCLFVFTDQSPPGLRRDTNRAPNSSWFPPDRGG
jgi:hypothetical protein